MAARFGGDKASVVEDSAAATMAAAPSGPAGHRNDGALMKAANKGTERVPTQVGRGAPITEMDASNDEMYPPIMHQHGPYRVWPNTNPGKGTEIRPESIPFGASIAETFDNDSLTGADGDDNDVAARIAGKGGFDG